MIRRLEYLVGSQGTAFVLGALFGFGLLLGAIALLVRLL